MVEVLQLLVLESHNTDSLRILQDMFSHILDFDI